MILKSRHTIEQRRISDALETATKMLVLKKVDYLMILKRRQVLLLVISDGF
jgi:hypothetical protein